MGAEENDVKDHGATMTRLVSARYLKWRWLRVLLLICMATLTGLALHIPPAAAAATPWVNSDFSQIRLIAAYDKSGRLSAGLHIRLEDGWKTYWRSPGDSGVPTMADWSASAGVKVSGLAWPVPRRVMLSGYQSFVYQDEVVLPLRLKAQADGVSVTFRSRVDYAVCKEICVPLHADLQLKINPGSTGPGDKVHRRLLKKFAARVPLPAKVSSTVSGASFASDRPGGVRLADIRLAGTGEQQVLVILLESKNPMQKPEMFVEAPQPFSFAVPDVDVSKDGGASTFTFRVNGGRRKLPLAGQQVVITVAAAGQALEVHYLLPKN
jgi:suppressor for copper-sensitivity B